MALWCHTAPDSISSEERRMLWLKRLIREEAAQDLIEYALLAAFISLAVVVSIDLIGKSLNTTYDEFSKQIDGFSAS